MVKKDLAKNFIDENYSLPRKKIYPTNNRIYNYIDEIWSNVLVDMIDHKVSNNKGFRYVYIL